MKQDIITHKILKYFGSHSSFTTVIWNNFTVLLVSEFEILIWICFVVTDLKFQLLSGVHAHNVVWCTYFVAIFMKKQYAINYIDNVFWLRLEILYIFNIKLTRYQFSTSQIPAKMKSFNVSNSFQSSVCVKAMP